MTASPGLTEEIKRHIRDIPGFPEPGIIFKDITPLLANASLFQRTADAIANDLSNMGIEVIAAIEARGFIFGAALAYRLGCALVPIRKSGKLPHRTVRADYALEYGTASIEMHADAISNGCKVLIHDDLLATGGTATAAGRLIQQLGGHIVGFSFLINLTFLHGEDTIMKHFGALPRYLVNY